MKPANNLVKDLIREFHEKLAHLYPVHEIRQIVHMLFDEYLGWPKTRVHMSYGTDLPPAALGLFSNALNGLCSGKPIQHIINKAWFNDTILVVNEHVLVPRPETEELCSIIKADYSEKQDDRFSILDIGTGSGCIAIDLKKYFPNSEMTAIDRSLPALEIAMQNALASKCSVIFNQVDILAWEQWTVAGLYHLIVSNPPYVLESEKAVMHPNVLQFEPAEALFVDDDDPLVFYRAISGFAAGHLIPPGRLYFEINENYGREVREVVRSYGFEGIRILTDFHGKDRFVSAMLRQ